MMRDLVKHARVHFFSSFIVYINEYIYTARDPLRTFPLPPRPFPRLARPKEAKPFNARGEPSVVVYLHNLWGSKNAKKLISRPRSHRPGSSSFQSRLHLLSAPRSPPSNAIPSSSSSSSSSFARVCLSALSPGSSSYLRSFVSRLFPQVRINFYLVCGVRNLFRDILPLLVLFFPPPSMALRSVATL